jgi:predicted DNA-binding transcriptional regulator AlpA
MIAAHRWLNVSDMAHRSKFSKSYFYTNRSLAKNGHKAASLPPMVEIGRSIRCQESLFEAWLGGRPVDLGEYSTEDRGGERP